MILAIDPGNKESGYALIWEDNYHPFIFGKLPNDELLVFLECEQIGELLYAGEKITTVIEMVASYGMPVGETVFDTCVWIGRFTQYLTDMEIPVSYVKRKEYVTEFCGSSRAKDANVIQYLVDRFAPDTPNHGKGTKKEPGWFYGFKADAWQAYAIAVYALDRRKNGNDKT